MAGLGQAGHSPGRLTVAAHLRDIGSSAPTPPSGDAPKPASGSVTLHEGAGPVPVRARPGAVSFPSAAQPHPFIIGKP